MTKLRATLGKVIAKYVQGEVDLTGHIIIPQSGNGTLKKAVIVDTNPMQGQEELKIDDLIYFNQHHAFEITHEDEKYYVIDYRDILASIVHSI